MNIKKTVKTDMVIKEAKLFNGKIIDEDGNVIDLIETIEKIYGEEVEFKLTLTRSTSEEIDIEELDEVDIEDLA